MTKEARKWMIVALVVLVVAITSGSFLIVWLLDVSFVKAIGLVQAVVTVLAISAGAAFAVYKLEVFRDFQPHLTITHEISHRRIGNRYVHISVGARLTNSSKVVVEIRNALFRLQQISPANDAEIEQLYSDFGSKSDEEKYFQFPTVVEFNRRWEKDEFVIEPGETESENYEFIVADDFDAVKVTAFFTDQIQITDHLTERGWLAVSVHDLNCEVGVIR